MAVIYSQPIGIFLKYWEWNFWKKLKGLLKEIKDGLLSFGRQLCEMPESKFVM